MDMTLARVAEQQMNVPGGRLDAARFRQLVQSCRLAKEAMLSGRELQTPERSVSLGVTATRCNIFEN